MWRECRQGVTPGSGFDRLEKLNFSTLFLVYGAIASIES